MHVNGIQRLTCRVIINYKRSLLADLSADVQETKKKTGECVALCAFGCCAFRISQFQFPLISHNTVRLTRHNERTSRKFD